MEGVLNMARVHLKQPDELTGDARKAYDALTDDQKKTAAAND